MIREISKAEFDAYNPSRGGLQPAIADEAEWYEHEGRVVIGVVIRDRIDDDWSFVVLGPDQNGQYRAIDVLVSIKDAESVRVKLHASMEEQASSGKKVFPQ